MAVTATRFWTAGLFVPWMQRIRGGEGHGSPVGTLHMDAEATGDGSGGSVTIFIAGTREMFGFRALLVPTLISVSDALAAVSAVLIQWTAVGNRRLSANINEVVTTVRVAGENHAILQEQGMTIEPPTDVNTNGFTVLWATNLNLAVYHFHVVASVYDLEIIEKYGTVDPLVAGIR